MSASLLSSASFGVGSFVVEGDACTTGGALWEFRHSSTVPRTALPTAAAAAAAAPIKGSGTACATCAPSLLRFASPPAPAVHFPSGPRCSFGSKVFLSFF